MDFSVVIPTYNRSEILVQTLEALIHQAAEGDQRPFSFEVIVVDDGSTDDTERRVKDLMCRWSEVSGCETNEVAGDRRPHLQMGPCDCPCTPLKNLEEGRLTDDVGSPGPISRRDLRLPAISIPSHHPSGQRSAVSLVYMRQSNRKQGAARNLGARQARGDFLVFLGDDTIPAPGFLSHHARARQVRAEWVPDSRLVIIGRTRWAPRLVVSRFMEYIGEQGWQFGFSLIADPEKVPFNFFYTSNLSIARQFFLASSGFDEDFQEYGWEDIELSLRLSERGMRLVYEPDAVAWHDHPTSLRSFIGRQQKVGYSAWRFYQKHPEMAEFLSVLKVHPYPWQRRIRMGLLTALCAFSETSGWPDVSRYYPDLMSYYYNLGVLRARQGQ
ncbi:MAG: glycosyltransferase [Acidobacteria bacterium]|nr:MAG: glycosyltransferase [Acidobacteriota bacterium]